MKEAFSVKNNADALIFHTAICFATKANRLYRRTEWREK